MSSVLTPLPLRYIRQYPESTDIDETFASTAERMAYLTNPRRYPGQIVSDLEQDGAVWVLNTARDKWNQVGSNIEIADNYAGISKLTNRRLIYVVSDETNNGDISLYIHTGVKIVFLQTVATPL